jgi:hypothetical protein
MDFSLLSNKVPSIGVALHQGRKEGVKGVTVSRNRSENHGNHQPGRTGNHENKRKMENN